jgi:hypothetical protein
MQLKLETDRREEGWCTMARSYVICNLKYLPQVDSGQLHCVCYERPGLKPWTVLEIKLHLKNGAFWDVTPCGSCKNRRFGGTQRLLHQGDKNRWTMNASLTSNRRTLRRNTKWVLRNVRQLLVTASVVPSSPILVTLMKNALLLRNVGSYKIHTA